MTMLVSGVFTLLKKATKMEEKQEIMQKYGTPMLKTIIQLAYNPNVKWLVPKGAPPYKPNRDKEETMQIKMGGIHKKFKLFFKGGGYDNWNQGKREAKFIEILESVHPDEAKLILAMIEGTLPGLTKQMFVKMKTGLLEESIEKIAWNLK